MTIDHIPGRKGHVYTDAMIDLETLGTAPGSVVTQIGIQLFDLFGGRIDLEAPSATLQVHIDIADSQKQGLQINGDTVKWWLGQGDEARAAMTKKGVDLHHAMWKVAAFLFTTTSPEPPGHEGEPYAQLYGIDKKTRVWGNGASFDLVLWREVCKAVGAPVPWGYRQEMCYRTLRAMYPILDDECLAALDDDRLTAHVAVSDATAQAIALQKAASYGAFSGTSLDPKC